MGCHYELEHNGVTVRKDEFGLDYLLNNFYHYDGTISDIVFNTGGLSEKAQKIHDTFESKFGKNRTSSPSTNVVPNGIVRDGALEIEMEGNAEAIALLGEGLPKDKECLGVSNFLALKGMINTNGQNILRRFEEDEFFETFDKELRSKTMTDISRKRFLMEFFGTSHAEGTVEYENDWKDLLERLSVSQDMRDTAMVFLRIKWYYQKGYGRLMHAIAQKVVRFIESRKSFDDSMIPELSMVIKKSDAYQEAMRIEDSENNQVANKLLDDSNMDTMINSISKGVLSSLYNINVLDFKNGTYYLKPDTKLYAEVPVKGKTHIPYPQGSSFNGNFSISGVIDLIVVDDTGKAKIFDWKAGLIHSYDDYNSKYQARRETIAYQLAIYRRLLANTVGIREDDIDCAFIGYEHKNFHLDKKGSSNPEDWIYTAEDIVPFGGEPYAIDYSTSHRMKIDTLDMYIVKEQPELRTNENMLQQASDLTAKLFGNTNKEYSNDDVKEIIAKNGGVYKNNEGKYECVIYSQKFIGETDADVRAKAIEFIKNPAERKGFGTEEHVRNMTKKIKELKQKGLEYTGMKNNTNNTGNSQTYFNDLINKYIKGPYEVLEMSEDLSNTLAKLGMICMRNTYTGAVDVIHMLKINEVPYKTYTNNNGSYITNKLSFSTENTDKKLLKNTVGSRNAIIDTILLSRLAKENGIEIPIGRILSVNEYYNRGEVVSNEQVHYSINKLMRYSGMDMKELSDIKLLSKAGLCQNVAQEIIGLISNPMTKKGLSKIEKLKDDILEPIALRFSGNNMYIHAEDADVDNSIAGFLYEMINIVDEHKESYSEIMTFAQTLGIQTIDEELYQYMNSAYAKAMGYDYTQDAEYKTATWNFKKMQVTVNNLENAGYFDNATINTMTTAMVENLQLLRQRLAGYLPDIRSHVNKLAESKGFGKIEERTIGNKTSIYSNLIVKGEDYMNFKHLDDPSLSGEEKDFLKFTLETINKKRGISPDNEKYYWVPLMRGEKYSAANIKEYIARAKTEFTGLLADGENSLEIDGGLTVENKSRQSDFWTLNNSYAEGDSKMSAESRKIKIMKTDGGVGVYEDDIENILLGFIFENERLDTLKHVMPIVKAGYAYIHNASLYGNLDNKKMKSFIEDYVRVNVHRESIVDEAVQKPMRFVHKLKNLVTKFALAFSPVQFTYQMLAGNLKNLELALSKHDVNCNFSVSELLQAKKVVYKCMFTDNGTKTIVDLLNEYGGFNAVNMKHYTDSVTSNRNGIHHLGDRLAMKFAEKPDFYNRLELAVAQMIHDGYFFGCVTEKDGKIDYNFKKDGRFKHIANGDLTSKDAKEELGLYYAMAKEMANDGICYPDGKPFLMPQFGKVVPLPTFWTKSQVTTLKDVGDLAYGYYDDMNKMMFSHEWFGQLVTHFRTYWPAKKSQYLASGGTKLRGHYAQKVERVTNEDGTETLIKYYYKKDKNGNLTDEITTNENEAFCPYQEWVGDYHEGIFSSIIEVVKSTLLNSDDTTSLKELKRRIDNGTATTIEKSMYYEKVGNLTQALYTLSLLAIGCLAKNLASDLLKWLKEDDDDTIADAMAMDSAVLLQRTIESSLADFEPWGSLMGPIVDSNPIAIAYVGNICRRYVNCITGDYDAWDATVRATSATRSWQNTIEYCLKPDYIDEQKGVFYPGKSVREKASEE